MFGGFQEQGPGVPFLLDILLNSARFDCKLRSIAHVRGSVDKNTPLGQCSEFFKQRIDQLGQETIDEVGSSKNVSLMRIQLIMGWSFTIGLICVPIGVLLQSLIVVVLGSLSLLVYIVSGLAIYYHFKPEYNIMYEDWADQTSKKMPVWIEEYKQQHCQTEWIVTMNPARSVIRLERTDWNLLPNWFKCCTVLGFIIIPYMFVYLSHPCCMKWESDKGHSFKVRVTTAAQQQQSMQMGVNTGVAMAAAPDLAANPRADNQPTDMQAQFANLDPAQQRSMLASLQAMQKEEEDIPYTEEGAEPITSEGVPSTKEGVTGYPGV